MDARQQRGIEIAARFKVVRRDRDWVVPSQSERGKKYTVSGLDVDTPRCNCPDFETRGEPCKHVFAVKVVIQREFEFDGENVSETVTVTKTVKRTYPQNWPAYNKAQTNEKDHFMVLLRDLCDGLPEPEQKRGRPRLPIRDAVFTAVMKVYTTASARRSMSDLSGSPRARVHQQTSLPQFRAERAGKRRSDSHLPLAHHGEQSPTPSG